VSKGVEDGRRPHPLWAVSRVVHPQGVEGLGMAGPSDTLGSPWPLLAHTPYPMPIPLALTPYAHEGRSVFLEYIGLKVRINSILIGSNRARRRNI
jgi:hypothetical protein